MPFLDICPWWGIPQCLKKTLSVGINKKAISGVLFEKKIEKGKKHQE
jgi:hypothetical protein